MPMYIIPSEIEKFCRKVNFDIVIEVDPVDRDVVFRIVKGRYEQNGSTAVFITGKEVIDILYLNEIIGEGGKVNALLKSKSEMIDQQIHELIYGLLANYVIQMLSAAMGKDYFPELKALPQHRVSYFWRS